MNRIRMLVVCLVCTLVCTLVCPVARSADEQESPPTPKRLPGWGAVIDPDGDCKFEHEEGRLTVTIPGTVHDLYPPGGSVNAPRVLAEATGDFTVRVKVSGDFNPGQTPARGFDRAWRSAGLLVWQNERNYVRLERGELFWRRPNPEHRYHAPLLQQRLGGRYNETALGQRVSLRPVFKGPSTYLRLDRSGDMMSAFVSNDGKEWQLIKEFQSFGGEKVRVGVCALNTSGDEFKVSFEGFSIAPKKD